VNQVELEQYAKKYDAMPITEGELSPRASLGHSLAPAVNTHFDGDKFFGGFGDTKLFTTDYWTLRKRSDQLFRENLYARGLIRRLITNEINTGITPEACPDEELIGVPEDSLNAWTETVENRFALWGKDPEQCDWKHRATFGAIQRAARMEALISGDVLVVLRQSNKTNLPMVQLISGEKVQSPLGGSTKLAKGHEIRHGVELDRVGRVVAYWVRQDSDGQPKRLPAKGARSGRRLAWLVFGTEKRLDDVRGEPLLSLVLQSLKEIDRYRDSTQRKAVINSILAMFIKKTEDKQGTRPITAGATRRGQATTTDHDGSKRTFNIAEQVPGLIIEELQVGEEPVMKGGEGTDINFGPFEEAIIQAVAWANEIPPEILRLAFSNNYSASQAAINEFKIYLNKVWSDWGETFCQPIYIDWLLSENLRGRIQAPGLLDAWRDPQRQDVFGAWVATDWYGSIKPSTDMLKQAKGSKQLIDQGWSSNAREARMLTGTKFSKNIKRLKRENEMKAEAARPLAEFEQEFGKPVDQVEALDVTDVEALIEEYLTNDQ
jgi:capsid protein